MGGDWENSLTHLAGDARLLEILTTRKEPNAHPLAGLLNKQRASWPTQLGRLVAEEPARGLVFAGMMPPARRLHVYGSP